MLSITPFNAAEMFMVGLLGSGHCMGMCGPLVVALPGQTNRLSGHLCYHLGRLLTYGTIGALMGGAGSGLMHLASFMGADPLVWVGRVQVGLSFAIGVFLILMGLSYMGFIGPSEWLSVANPGRLPGWRRLFSKAMGRLHNKDLFIMGLLLGALPCGLSYVAFARALSEADIVRGAALAFIFGLGTLPSMVAVGAGAAFFLNRFRQQAIILAGLMMIGMGANLMVKIIGGVG